MREIMARLTPECWANSSSDQPRSVRKVLSRWAMTASISIHPL